MKKPGRKAAPTRCETTRAAGDPDSAPETARLASSLTYDSKRSNFLPSDVPGPPSRTFLTPTARSDS